MISIVGIGPGNAEHITQAAISCIEKADILIGGKRLLKAASNVTAISKKEKIEISGHTDKIIEIIQSVLHKNKDKNIAILVSGDPGFYSLSSTIRNNFKDIEFKVIPGISSVQMLFSLIGREWQDVVFTSVHGRSLSQIDDVLKIAKLRKKICVLTDKKTHAAIIAKYLVEKNIKGKAIIGANLSYPDQLIIETTINELAVAGSDLADLTSVISQNQCILYLEID